MGDKIYILCRAHKKTMEAIAIPPKDRDIKASWPPRICQSEREVWTGNTRPEKLLIRIQSDGKKFHLPSTDTVWPHIESTAPSCVNLALPKYQSVLFLNLGGWSWLKKNKGFIYGAWKLWEGLGQGKKQGKEPNKHALRHGVRFSCGDIDELQTVIRPAYYNASAIYAWPKCPSSEKLYQQSKLSERKRKRHHTTREMVW